MPRDIRLREANQSENRRDLRWQSFKLALSNATVIGYHVARRPSVGARKIARGVARSAAAGVNGELAFRRISIEGSSDVEICTDHGDHRSGRKLSRGTLARKGLPRSRIGSPQQHLFNRTNRTHLPGRSRRFEVRLALRRLDRRTGIDQFGARNSTR